MNGRRVTGGCFLALFLCLAIGTVMTIVIPARDDGKWTVAAVLGILALPVGLLSWWWLKRPKAAPTGYQWDLLWQGLNVHPVPEKGGVQWSMLAFPDSLQPPGHVVLAFLAQNCTSMPRMVWLKVTSPDPRIPSRDLPFGLKAGESGLFRVPFLFPAGLPTGPWTMEYAVEVDAPQGTGLRVIRNEGLAPRTALHFHQVTVDLLQGGSARIVNEFAREWSGFQPIFETGKSAPDLEPLRLLAEPRSSP